MINTTQLIRELDDVRTMTIRYNYCYDDDMELYYDELKEMLTQLKKDIDIYLK